MIIKTYKKFLLLYLTASTILIGFSYYTLQSRINSLLVAEQALIFNAFQATINAFKYQSDILYINRINRPVVIEIFKHAQDSSALTQAQVRKDLYDELIDMYQTMQHFQLKQLHFHLPNNHSFLRFHRPEAYGDDLSGVRRTIDFVNKTKQRIDGFEEGRIYNGYRYVFPLFDDKTYLGSVETSVSMDVILQEMNKNIGFESDFIIKSPVVKAQVFKTEQANYTHTNFDSNFMHDRTIHPENRPLINQMMQRYLETHHFDNQSFNSLQFFNGQFYLLNGLAIPSALTQETVAYLLSAVENSEVKELYIEFFITVFAILIILLVFTKILHKTDQQKYTLEHEQEVYQRVESLSALGSWEIDLASNEMTWSKELYKLLDYPTNSTQPTFELLLERVHPEDRGLVTAFFKKATEEQQEMSLEHRVLRKAGSLGTVKQTISHSVNSQGSPTSIIGMLLDISDLKQFEAELEKARNSYEALLQNIPEIIYRANCNMDRTVQYINHAVFKHTGYEPILFEENQTNLNDLIHPEDRQRYLIALEKTLHGTSALTIEYRMEGKNGKCLWVHELTQIKYDETGCHLEGIIQNRTQEKLAQENLQKIIDLQDNIMLLTNGQSISFTNKSFFEVFAYDNLGSFLNNNQCVCEFFIAKEGFFSMELVNKGQLWTSVMLQMPESERIVLIKNQRTKAIHAYSVDISPFDQHQEIVVLTDITDSLQKTEELRKAANHDNLTGLYNRSFITHNFKILTHGAKAKNLRSALIMFDIDHFKKVNDTYGHNCGDEVLATLAQQVSQRLRASDVLVRWGGEEFFVLSEVSHVCQALRIAENLRLAIANITFGCSPNITCSFGVTLVEDTDTLEKTVERADKALYSAKNSGRNKVCSHVASVKDNEQSCS